MKRSPAIGEVVYLHSGGPDMTVGAIAFEETGETYALCQWFEGRNFQERYINIEALGRAS